MVEGAHGKWGVNCTKCQCAIGLDYSQETGQWLGFYHTTGDAAKHWNRRSPDAYALVEKVLRNREVLELALGNASLREMVKLASPTWDHTHSDALLKERESKIQQLIDLL